MAYTSAPQVSTYSTERIPAVYDIQLRDNSTLAFGSLNAYIFQDAGMVNLIPRKIKDATNGKETMVAATRPSLQNGVVFGSTTTPRGAYIWQKDSSTVYYFTVCDKKVYTSTDGTTFANVSTFTNTGTNPVGFTEFINSATNTKMLIVSDGIELFKFTTNAAGTLVNAASDPQFPTPHLPFPVYLDGYLFLAKTDTGDIYNSDLNDPTSWTAGNFISSELYPDDVKYITKINNYLLAVGTQGCEYFYDAANATASPLARYEGSSLPFGTFFPYSAASNKNTVVLITNNNEGEPCLTIVQDFKHKDITPTWLMPILNAALANGHTTSDLVRGMFIRTNGDLLYLLQIRAPDGAYTYPTFVYCTDTGLWTEFRIGGVANAVTPSGNPFPAFCSAFSGANASVTYLLCQYTDAGVGAGRYPILLKFTGGSTGASGLDNLDNVLINIVSEIRTESLDFGTLNQKFMSRLGMIATAQSSAQTWFGYVYWWDQDITTGALTSSGSATITGTATNDFPFVTQLGKFRQRRFCIKTDVTLRIYAIEVDINKGQQ